MKRPTPRPPRQLRALAVILSLAALSSLLAGCGAEPAPSAPTDDTLAQQPAARSFLTFSADGMRRAGKIAGRLAFMGADAGVALPRSETNYQVVAPSSDEEDLYEATFHVPRKGVESPVLISMEAYGEVLSEIIIAFEPEGLEFAEAAELTLRLGKDRIDLDPEDLVVLHEHGDGSVEVATITGIVIDEDDGITVTVSVPGFSRYSTGGGY